MAIQGPSPFSSLSRSEYDSLSSSQKVVFEKLRPSLVDILQKEVISPLSKKEPEEQKEKSRVVTKVADTKAQFALAMTFCSFFAQKPAAKDIEAIFTKYVGDRMSVKQDPVTRKGYSNIDRMDGVVAYLKENSACTKLFLQAVKGTVGDIETLAKGLKESNINEVRINQGTVSAIDQIRLNSLTNKLGAPIKITYLEKA